MFCRVRSFFFTIKSSKNNPNTESTIKKRLDATDTIEIGVSEGIQTPNIYSKRTTKDNNKKFIGLDLLKKLVSIGGYLYFCIINIKI